MSLTAFWTSPDWLFASGNEICPAFFFLLFGVVTLNVLWSMLSKPHSRAMATIDGGEDVSEAFD